MRKFDKFNYPENMDAECVSLCDALNTLPGVTTLESCSGHGKSPFMIWFKCGVAGMAETRGLFFVARCVNSRYWKYGHLWRLYVDISDTPTVPLPVRYVLSSESQVGEDAYAQARDLFANMLYHLNHEGFLKGFYDNDDWYERLGSVDWRSLLLLRNYDMLPSDPKWPVAMFGVECGEGWKSLLENLFADIRVIAESDPSMPPVRVLQIKEKFGALRFYYDGGNNAVADAVRNAEHASYETCELCGSTKDVGHTSGWILTCCRKCYDSSEEPVRSREWKPIIKTG